MITPPPTLPSFCHVESRPMSLATQSVTLDSSSVHAGEHSQLKLRTEAMINEVVPSDFISSI